MAFYFLSRDRPTDVGLPQYFEEDEASAKPEAVSEEQLRGFVPYRELLVNSRFHLASHVKGLENVVRYGFTTWVLIYHFEAGGLSIESTVLLTVLLPVGSLLATPLFGIISYRLLNSARRPMVIASCVISTGALIGIALIAGMNGTKSLGDSPGRAGILRPRFLCTGVP